MLIRLQKRLWMVLLVLALGACGDRPIAEPDSAPCGAASNPAQRVDRSVLVEDLVGDETSLSIRARSGEAHLSYWACSNDGPPGKGGLPTLGTCSGHRYALARREPRAVLRRETIARGSGRSTVLALDAAGVPSALSLGDQGSLFYDAERGAGSWTSEVAIGKDTATELQHLYVTGRMPNGENLVAATRTPFSGTRNGSMNSLGT